MKYIFCGLFLIIFIAAFTAGVFAADTAVGDKQVQLVVEGNNEFAVSLYKRVVEQDENMFFSPYSISTALAMTYAGARKATEEAMWKTLRFPFGGDNLHRSFGVIQSELNDGTKSGNYTLFVANRLWPARGEEIEPEFEKIVKSCYNAGIEPLDYDKNPEAARKTINMWVEKQTRNKIKDLVPAGGVDQATAMVLTNAIYFLGNWDEQFDEKRTGEDEFTIPGTGKVNVPMMHRKGRYRYGEVDGAQILDIPYKGKQLSMIILLPNDDNGLVSLERSFTVEKLAGWLGHMREQTVTVGIPRFKLSSGFSLSKVLSSMGMKNAFGPGADFSGMMPGVFISEVFHKAYVDVNERGTEAAAATAVVMTRNGGGEYFTADHPFMFLIRDNKTGSILFMGRVVNPAGK